MQDKKYYYDEQVKNFFFEEHFREFSKVKKELENSKLETLLGNETKQVLTDIAKRIEMRGYSKLTKDALASNIANNIKEQIPSLLGELSYKEIRFLEKLSKAKLNEYVFNIEELSLIGSLSSLGFIAKVNVDKKFYIVLAEEVKPLLKETLSNKEYMESLKERSKGIAYIDGLMIHYGMLEGADLYKLISESESEFINKNDLDFYFNYIFRSYEAFKDANAIIHPFVLSPEDTFAEIHARQVIPYDFNNIEYLIKLGEDSKSVWGQEIINLRKQLLENNITEDKVDSLITELLFYIKNEMGTMSIVGLLEARGVVFKNGTKKSEDLVAAVADVYNNTPVWTLKGLTPIELEKRRSTPVVKTKEPGRNEPCPCGSGKKYKKCCGKN